MKASLLQLRSYYGFKKDYPIGKMLFPWNRRRLKSLLKQDSLCELVRTDNAFLIPVDSLEYATNRVQCRGSIDVSMEWVIKRYAKQNTLAIDVGCNVGLLALLMADAVGDLGEVYAVEPNPSLHEYIKKLFRINALSNMTLFQAVCSREKGNLSFCINGDDHTKSKLALDGGLRVGAIPIDELVKVSNKPLSLIKIDVEGHELDVLKGAVKTLKEKRPTLVFETGMHSKHDIDEINHILDEVDYEVLGVINDWGIESKPLTASMTNKSHCNVLALPR